MVSDQPKLQRTHFFFIIKNNKTLYSSNFSFQHFYLEWTGNLFETKILSLNTFVLVVTLFKEMQNFYKQSF